MMYVLVPCGTLSTNLGLTDRLTFVFSFHVSNDGNGDRGREADLVWIKADNPQKVIIFLPPLFLYSLLPLLSLTLHI